MRKRDKIPVERFVSSGRAAQEADVRALEKNRDAEPREESIKPEDLPTLLIEDIRRRKIQIDELKEYFVERKINPYREAFEIILSFFNKFDTVAGLKAK
jgi:hypothetical protein